MAFLLYLASLLYPCAGHRWAEKLGCTKVRGDLASGKCFFSYNLSVNAITVFISGRSMLSLSESVCCFITMVIKNFCFN